MIKSVQLSKEIRVTVINKIGVLADMAKLLAEHGLNIEAIAGYEVNKEGHIMIVADDVQRTADALKKAGYKMQKETEVIAVELENKPGALKTITTALAKEEIDIKQIYGTSCSYGCPARVIISTSNDEKALLIFTKLKK